MCEHSFTLCHVICELIEYTGVSLQDKEDASQGMAEQSSSSEATDGSSTQHAFFSKYDAVEKYLKGKGYPPGLTSVEKNTFRRLCSRFSIHGDDSDCSDQNKMFSQLTDIWREKNVRLGSRLFLIQMANTNKNLKFMIT